jgi:glycosyltransferase involved in cell wall biosynthesis
MADRKLRVLIDISMATRGYCGIAQDVRLLYKTLVACPNLEVSGLVYHPRRFGPRHQFVAQDAPLADRLANQAGYLWGLSSGAPAWPNVKPWRLFRQAQQLASAVCRPRVPLDRLETDRFTDAVWRMLFSQTLPPQDRTLVERGSFLISNLSDGMIYARALARLRPFKLDTRGFDYFIVQGPRPFRVSPETRQIVRYHDMIPLLQPDTMSNPMVIKWHHRAIRQCRDQAFFVCSSDPTRDDLSMLYPELLERSCTIPHMLSNAYYPEQNRQMVDRIIARRRSSGAGPAVANASGGCPRYIMCVSSLEPRKNFIGLIHAFNLLKGRAAASSELAELKLIIVGSPGWNHAPIEAAMRDPIARGELVHLENVPADELRVLYSHTEAFVFPSYHEGFGFPPLEAMQCGAPVIASDICAHRWTLGDGALYCQAHDAHSIAAAVERLVASNESKALRQTLIAAGNQRVKLYDLDRCARDWANLLDRLSSRGIRHLGQSGDDVPASSAIYRAA